MMYFAPDVWRWIFDSSQRSAENCIISPDNPLSHAIESEIIAPSKNAARTVARVAIALVIPSR